jgi:hypothetical protein
VEFQFEKPERKKFPALSAEKRSQRKAVEAALSKIPRFFTMADIAFEAPGKRCYADSSIRDAIFFTGGITCSALEIIALTEIVPIFGSFFAPTLVVAAAAAKRTNNPSVQ